jgi:hypothetical protein
VARLSGLNNLFVRAMRRDRPCARSQGVAGQPDHPRPRPDRDGRTCASGRGRPAEDRSGALAIASATSGAIAETYLRTARAYGGPLPPTLGFLPARNDYPPAIIAAFGIPNEGAPGVLALSDAEIKGVHLTRLLPDGSDRDRGEKAKIMIGMSCGAPIVLAPPNDLLGLVITEGIEDGLSAHMATGLGSWVAGSASACLQFPMRSRIASKRSLFWSMTTKWDAVMPRNSLDG